MKNRFGKQIGWIFVLLHILVQAAAVAMYFTTGNYQVSYGLFAILLFSYFAGAYLFGLKNMILMNLISACFAFLFENTSVSFGFPFGFFEHFTSGMRIINVPLQVGFGYYFYAFSGWLFADLMLSGSKNDRLLKFERPLIGSFIASAMDLTTDAINGLVLGNYDYPHGGGFFGSPLTNSLGWIFTTFLILMVWELLIIPHTQRKQEPTPWHLQNAILLGLQITAPLLGFLITKNREITDVLGNTWQSSYVYEASAMIALLALVPAMLLGIFTYMNHRTERKEGK
jgi:uncharacterized membrane protein